MNAVQTALIVDDESGARWLLEELLRAHPEVRVIGRAASVGEAAHFLEGQTPDLIFLDWEMPGPAGLALLGRVAARTRVIFVTAHAQYALSAIQAGAQGYLLKPVHPGDLALVLERMGHFAPVAGRELARGKAAESREEEVGPIMLRHKGVIHLLAPQDILWVEAEQNYSRVYCQEEARNATVLKSLSSWEKDLPPEVCFRVSRSVLVRLGAISSLRWSGREDTLVHFEGSAQVLRLGRTAAGRLRLLLKD